MKRSAAHSSAKNLLWVLFRQLKSELRAPTFHRSLSESYNAVFFIVQRESFEYIKKISNAESYGLVSKELPFSRIHGALSDYKGSRHGAVADDLGFSP
jgi:hypothetical protein